jgi:DTW domain-containing protein YfiP
VKVKRAICPSCVRPQSTCICKWIAPVARAVEVLILQHPVEVNNAKGSARLLHLCLPNSRMVTGEVFDSSVLLPASKNDILLYPDTMQDQALDLPVSPSLPARLANTLGAPAQIRLIVLDATWRKSRKMLYLNPLLHRLPRLSLQGLPASSYRIRKAHSPEQLSTLEATCAALAQLDGNREKYQPLLAAFDGFVAQQMCLAAQGLLSHRGR